MSISPPQSGEYNPYYHEYIRRVPEGDVLALMATQIEESLALLRSLSEEQVMLRPRRVSGISRRSSDTWPTVNGSLPIAPCALPGPTKPHCPVLTQTPMWKTATLANAR